MVFRVRLFQHRQHDFGIFIGYLFETILHTGEDRKVRRLIVSRDQLEAFGACFFDKASG
jgi:hypothetical protein